MRVAATVLLLALVGPLASGSAVAFKKGKSSGLNKGSGHAHHHGHRHHHHGHKSVSFVGFGFAYPWPWYYPAPYYYPYYQPVAYEAEPITYIEQSSTPAPEPTGWWYYCDASRAYYPYVRECPSGWERVPAAPPAN
jgi:hypothetical protein